eukprot:TRINITY_DN42295_c0_g1_i1.p1 TRINITY_DN42295_c0_g1~~TRINITY_DN42295_c0_g1_i1.p1  ORF type:complete len:111 (-),score=17.90 TRINITY_DN42295_c0_g1_i1:31-339(-)
MVSTALSSKRVSTLKDALFHLRKSSKLHCSSVLKRGAQLNPGSSLLGHFDRRREAQLRSDIMAALSELGSSSSDLDSAGHDHISTCSTSLAEVPQAVDDGGD